MILSLVLLGVFLAAVLEQESVDSAEVSSLGVSFSGEITTAQVNPSSLPFMMRQKVFPEGTLFEIPAGAINISMAVISRRPSLHPMRPSSLGIPMQIQAQSLL